VSLTSTRSVFIWNVGQLRELVNKLATVRRGAVS
jgi:hypothetical protein